jgi:hypothetical protein
MGVGPADRRRVGRSSYTGTDGFEYDGAWKSSYVISAIGVAAVPLPSWHALHGWRIGSGQVYGPVGGGNLDDSVCDGLGPPYAGSAEQPAASNAHRRVVPIAELESLDAPMLQDVPFMLWLLLTTRRAYLHE